MRLTADALVGSPTLRIIAHLKDRGWLPAASLSRDLRIHPATVEHHLEELCRAGLLDRRLVRVPARRYEYQLKPGKVHIGLGPEGSASDETGMADFYVDLLQRFMERVERIAGKPLQTEFLGAVEEQGKSEGEVSTALRALGLRLLSGGRFPARSVPHDPPTVLGMQGVVSVAMAIAMKHLGVVAARMLLVSAAREAAHGREGLVERMQLLRGIVEG